MALEISYWGGAYGNLPVPKHVVSSESLALSGSSAQSGAAPLVGTFLSLYATEDARFEIGSDPTATSASAFIAAGERLWLLCEAGKKIAGKTA